METKTKQIVEPQRQRRVYEPPSVMDYGNSAELTLQASLVTS